MEEKVVFILNRLYYKNIMDDTLNLAIWALITDWEEELLALKSESLYGPQGFIHLKK